MLLRQVLRRAASRAGCTAGSNNAISTPMIATTNSNSTSMKPLPLQDRGSTAYSPLRKGLLGSMPPHRERERRDEEHDGRPRLGRGNRRTGGGNGGVAEVVSPQGKVGLINHAGAEAALVTVAA